MQFKVPQNVEREDKIVGPLSLKQLIICTIGFGIAYSAYVYFGKRGYGLEFSIVIVLPTILFTIAFAFVKINDIPFIKWALLLLEFFLNNQKRVWIKGADTIRIVSVKDDKKSKTKKEEKTKTPAKPAHLHNLAEILDKKQPQDPKNKQITQNEKPE